MRARLIALFAFLLSVAALAQSPVTGTYRTELGDRTLTLVLSSNRNAQLTTDRPGRGPIVQKGTWRSQGDQVTVKLTSQNNKPNNETLVFDRDGDEMIATQYSPRKYGEDGLILSRVVSGGTSKKLAIESLVVSPARTLKPGDVLTIVLTGTPGARATYDLLGVIEEQPLPEIRPGRYQATLTIRSDMRANEATLLTQLVRGNDAVSKEASRPITIAAGETTRGTFTLYPGREERVSQLRPSIGATLPAAGGKFTLWVDGADVTTQAQHNGNSLLYMPPQNMSPGRHVARLLGSDGAGNAFDETWYFEVGSGSNTSTTAFPADGSVASGSRPDIGLTFGQPIQPGTVRFWVDESEVTRMARIGSNEVRFTPSFDLVPGSHRARVTGTYANGSNFDIPWGFAVVASSGTSTGGLQLFVTSPANGARVPSSFSLFGSATPNAIVEVSGVVTEPLIPGVIGVKSKRVQYSVYAERDGRWRIDVSLGSVSRRSSLEMTLQAKDGYGAVSQPVQLKVTVE